MHKSGTTALSALHTVMKDSKLTAADDRQPRVARRKARSSRRCWTTGNPAYPNHGTVALEPPADSFALTHATVCVARRLWRDGFRYAKAGVLFVDLCRAEQVPSEFSARDPKRSASLMKVLDTVNRRYGRDTLRPGGVGGRPDWSMRRAKLSPAYTSRMEDLLRVTAK